MYANKNVYIYKLLFLKYKTSEDNNMMNINYFPKQKSISQKYY